ncbi:hypothetical protein Tco_0497486 [Tanacetum coccineum]
MSPRLFSDSVCDVPPCNNPTSLEAFKEQSETIIDSNDDSTSSDDDSYENIDYVDASPPDAEIVSLEVRELAHIISPPEYDHFCLRLSPLGNLTMDVGRIFFQQRGNPEFI